MSILEQTDPDVFRYIQYELERQSNQLELIASENIVSQAILEAQGSILRISTQKVTRIEDIMVGVTMPMRSSPWP